LLATSFESAALIWHGKAGKRTGAGAWGTHPVASGAQGVSLLRKHLSHVYLFATSFAWSTYDLAACLVDLAVAQASGTAYGAR